jgi:peptidoglycan/LPS O-acetylase OafA/YrhL
MDANFKLSETTGLPKLPDIRYIPTLNGWRAISILIVFLSHAGLNQWVPGNMGVSIFFFLSGYLIMTLTLLECQGPHGFDVLKFYARRVIRLYPTLVVALLCIYSLWALGLIPGGLTWTGLSSQLLYLANYHYLFFYSANDVPSSTILLWSLAVEEHFYIVMPLLMALLIRRRTLRHLGLIMIALVLIALLWRIHLHMDGATFSRIYYSTDTRFDSIIYGTLLAIFWNPMREVATGAPTIRDHAWLLAGLIGLVACVAIRDDFFRDTFRYSLIGLSLMPVFHCAIRFSRAPIFKWLDHAWLQQIGKWSYAIYLIHLALIQALSGVTSHVWANNAMALVCACLFAYLIERGVETPMNGLRARFR